MRALLVLLAGALLAAAAPDDAEGDSAPFMVLVRHGDGRACSAALVSLRTALSSAACTAPAAELWAVAPGTPSAARRVLRLVRATEPPATELAGDPWAGAGSDLALLELAEPLPGAIPILMATDPTECAASQACNVVRALRPGPAGATRLRIMDTRLEPSAVCAARGPRWPALRAHTLCLAGAELCEADRGTGVVCGGKLCGVLSRSASAGGGARCGEVHAAAAVPRWRRFLHCAHTRGACGRDGDCAVLCEERWLVELGAEGPTSVERRAPPAEPLQLADRAAPQTSVAASSMPAPQRTLPPAQHPPPPEPAVGALQEFEPNRADFNTSASARVLLKAGEYDAPPEYSALEEPLRPQPSTTARVPPAPPARMPSEPPEHTRVPPATTRTTRLRMQLIAGGAPKTTGATSRPFAGGTALLPVLCAVKFVINIP